MKLKHEAYAIFLKREDYILKPGNRLLGEPYTPDWVAFMFLRHREPIE